RAVALPQFHWTGGPRATERAPLVLAPGRRIPNHGARPKPERSSKEGGGFMNRVVQGMLVVTLASLASGALVSAQSARFGVGGGFYNVKITLPSAVPPVDTSESKFAYAFGGGLKVGVGPARFFVEGRYVSIQSSGVSTKFIPVTVGVTFGAK